MILSVSHLIAPIVGISLTDIVLFQYSSEVTNVPFRVFFCQEETYSKEKSLIWQTKMKSYYKEEKYRALPTYAAYEYYSLRLQWYSGINGWQNVTAQKNVHGYHVERKNGMKEELANVLRELPIVLVSMIESYWNDPFVWPIPFHLTAWTKEYGKNIRHDFMGDASNKRMVTGPLFDYLLEYYYYITCFQEKVVKTDSWDLIATTSYCSLHDQNASVVHGEKFTIRGQSIEVKSLPPFNREANFGPITIRRLVASKVPKNLFLCDDDTHFL